MQLRNKIALAATAVAIGPLLAVALPAGPASGHGTMPDPAS